MVQARQIEYPCHPSEILGALSDHHILERTVQATGNLQFEHQQFQELYAAHTLAEDLERAIGFGELVSAYQREYIDWPAWEKSLRMLAKKIAGDATAAPLDAGAKAKLLVGMCAEVDLYFAATLARLCAVALPPEARIALIDRLWR